MAGIGFGAVTIGGNSIDNYKTGAFNGLGPRTRVLSFSKTNITQAELDSLVQALQAGGTSGTDDAVTVAAISAFEAGVTDVAYMAVQGTGTLTAGADYRGVTGVTMALVADFNDEAQNGGVAV
jgi:hypothetical protein